MSFEELYDAFKKANPQLSGQEQQKRAVALWNQAKKDFTDPVERASHVKTLVKDFLIRSTKSKALNLLSYFKSPPKPVNEGGDGAGVSTSTAENDGLGGQSEIEGSPPRAPGQRGHQNCIISDDEEEPGASQSRSAPAQNLAAARIAKLEHELNELHNKDRAGLSVASDTRRISEMTKRLQKERKGLQSMKASAERSKKYRDTQRSRLRQACSNNPDVARTLKMRDQRGRPRLEADQPGILDAIIRIATVGASADDRRRSELLRTCTTLDNLHEAMVQDGYQISRTATYLRLRPRKWASIEGKRHVITVPVKLCRVQNDLHRKHEDGYFCKASINALETVAAVLGPKQCNFLSQDDKARVPIGKTAANSQAPILMHMEYRVRLPDHDFPVGPSHCLIPSVYALITIKEDAMGEKSAVSYSGPTYVAVRSGKHDGSSASSHAKDLHRLLSIESFSTAMKDSSGKMKPVLMVSVDGGPDENPRFKKVIENAINTFKDNDLDAMFVFTNAPGRSAFNRVERRMAPLSKELSGLILPHDHFGSHLNDRQETQDIELEKQNFQYAGEALAEVWSGLKIDSYDVHAEYIPPPDTALEDEDTVRDEHWYGTHVRESQYLLQIVKCSASLCCKPMRSDIKNILYQGFLSGPFPIVQGPTGLTVPAPSDHDGTKFAPFLMRQTLDRLRPESPSYDLYCPSVQDEVAGRTCDLCEVYFASKTSLKNHKKIIHPRGREVTAARVRPLRVLRRHRGEVLCVLRPHSEADWVDVEELDPVVVPPEDEVEVDCEPMPIIADLDSWVQSPWVEEV